MHYIIFLFKFFFTIILAQDNIFLDYIYRFTKFALSTDSYKDMFSNNKCTLFIVLTFLYILKTYLLSLIKLKHTIYRRCKYDIQLNLLKYIVQYKLIYYFLTVMYKFIRTNFTDKYWFILIIIIY